MTELTIYETNLASVQAKQVSEEGWKASLSNLKELPERTTRS